MPGTARCRDAPAGRLYKRLLGLRGLLTLLAICFTLAACGEDSSPAAGDRVSATPTASWATSVVAFTNSAGQRVALNVEVAQTAAERGRGLMSRQLLAEDRGMLFVFQEDTQTGFYMKHTLIPLSIAFIDSAGVIVDIQDMQPQTTDVHYSTKPYRYAVEANQGWYAQRGVAVGDRSEVDSTE